LQAIKIAFALFILVVFCIAVERGHCGSFSNDRDKQAGLRAEIQGDERMTIPINTGISSMH